VSSLQERQFPIDQAIFGELLRCLPRGWAKATLVAEQDAGGASMRVGVDGAGQRGQATVSDELLAKVRELFVLNHQFNTDLKVIRYSYARGADGKWSFAGDYEYAD
jgi:hypothetical protein